MNSPTHPYIVECADKLFEKYEVTREQADIAAKTVSAWYEMKSKRTDPYEMIIIPQIPDWLVHEMITDTRRYKAFCQSLRSWSSRHVYVQAETDHTYTHITLDHQSEQDDHISISTAHQFISPQKEQSVTADHVSLEPAPESRVSTDHVTIKHASEHMSLEPSSEPSVDHNLISTSHMTIQPSEHNTLNAEDEPSHTEDHVQILPRKTVGDHMLVGNDDLQFEEDDEKTTAETAHQLISQNDLTSPRKAYQRTLNRLKMEYGIDCVAAGMEESGWDQPRYLFRHDRYAKLGDFQLTARMRTALHHIQSQLSDSVTAIQLGSWIDERMVRRFGISQDAAYLATTLYQLFLDNVDPLTSESIAIPDLIAAVWFEHALWTKKYRQDCDNIFGEFLHRPRLELTSYMPDLSDIPAHASFMSKIDTDLQERLLRCGWATAQLPSENLGLERASSLVPVDA